MRVRVSFLAALALSVACVDSGEKQPWCTTGNCQPKVFATCFNSGELVALDEDLRPVGPNLLVGGGPQSLAHTGTELLLGDTIDKALYGIAFGGTDPVHAPSADRVGVAFSQVLVRGTRAFAINSGDHNVQIIDLSRTRGDAAFSDARTVDQIPTGANTNPIFGAFVGEKLYVTLLGTYTAEGEREGNKLVEIDTASAPGKVLPTLSFASSDYHKEDRARTSSPRPGPVAALGSVLYVGIGNLQVECDEEGIKQGRCGSPAGPGYLAVVDTSAATLSSRAIRLPDSCRNPGYVLAQGERVYVSCLGAYGYGAKIEEALVVLDAKTDAVVRVTTFPRCPADAPYDGPQACKNATPGRMALQADRLLIADSAAGRLFVTDLEGRPVAGQEQGIAICPLQCKDGDTGCSQYTSDVLALP